MLQKHLIKIHKQGHESDSGISIADYRSKIPWVANGGIAIDGTDFLTHVQIEYPVTNGPFQFPIERQPSNDSGYSLRELVEIACEAYHQMYREEDVSSSVRAQFLHEDSLNRNKTNGNFGIWGHYLTDLSLAELSYEKNGNTLYTDVDS